MKHQNKPRVSQQEKELTNILKLIEPAEQKIAPAKDKHLALLMGYTGSGKSTLLNYLLGMQLKQGEIEGDFFPVPKNNRQKTYSKMGYSGVAETLYPAVFDVPNRGFTLCDCAGFEDNRGADKKVFATVGTHVAVKLSKSIQSIVLVISVSEIKAGRSTLLDQLDGLLPGMISDFGLLEKSVTFVITKAQTYKHPPSKAQLLKKIQTRVDKLKKENMDQYLGQYGMVGQYAKLVGSPLQYASNFKTSVVNVVGNTLPGMRLESLPAHKSIYQMMLDQPNKVIMFDPYDKGESRKAILSSIAMSTPIPQKLFVFNLRDEAHLAFTRAVFTRCEMACKQINRNLFLTGLLNENNEEIENLQSTIISYQKNKKMLSSKKQNKEEHNLQIAARTLSVQTLTKTVEKTKRAIRTTQTTLTKKEKEKENVTSKKEVFYTWRGIEKSSIPLFSWLFGWKIEETIHYKDIPFQRITVERKKDTGGETFTEKQNRPQEGIFKASYSTAEAQDAFIKINFFVQHCDIRENKSMAQILKTEIDNLNQEKTKKSNELSALETRLNSEHNVLCALLGQKTNVSRTLKELDTMIKIADTQVKKLKKDNEFHKKELNQVRSALLKDTKLNESIFKILGYLNFKDIITNRFKELFQQNKQLQKGELQINPCYESEHDNEEEQGLYCPIGSVLMRDPVNTKCGHTFDRKSLLEYMDNPVTKKSLPDYIKTNNLNKEIKDKLCPCPQCRKPVYSLELTPNTPLRQLIENKKRQKQKNRVQKNEKSDNMFKFKYSLYLSLDQEKLISKLKPSKKNAHGLFREILRSAYPRGLDNSSKEFFIQILNNFRKTTQQKKPNVNQTQPRLFQPQPNGLWQDSNQEEDETKENK